MGKKVEPKKILQRFSALWQGALVALSLTAAGVCRADQARPLPGNNDPALRDALLAKAEAAADAGHLGEAVEAWRAAWSLRPDDARVACGIGGAELRRGNTVDAATWLARCVRLSPKATTRHAVERSKQYALELLTAKAKVSALSIKVEPGARIMVDNEAPRFSPLADDVFVNPGKHHIEAQSGKRAASYDLVTEAGKAYSISLELRQSPAVADATSFAPAAVHAPLASPPRFRCRRIAERDGDSAGNRTDDHRQRRTRE